MKEWAAATGVSYATARRRYESGTLPVPTYRLGRLIMVAEPLTGAAPDPRRVVVYARVSSADQKPDLDRQVARVTAWITGRHLAVDRVMTEVGSALSGHGKKFLALLRDRAMSTIAVEHRDRLRLDTGTLIVFDRRPPDTIPLLPQRTELTTAQTPAGRTITLLRA